MILCLVIFVLTIASFLWGKISMGLTALLSMVLLVLTGCIDITTALSGFSNSNTIIMACMFIISAGFSKSQMVAKLSRGVAKAAKGSFTRVLTGYIIVTFLIAQIVPSAMAVFSIVFPLALGVCDEMKVSPSKIMFSIGIVAISRRCPSARAPSIPRSITVCSKISAPACSSSSSGMWVWPVCRV